MKEEEEEEDENFTDVATLTQNLHKYDFRAHA